MRWSRGVRRLSRWSAVIPGAKVTITETATGRVLPLVTDVAGRYSQRNLLPGTYDIKIEAGGFARKEIRNVTVSTSAVVNGSVVLDVGQPTEVIQVTAEAITVDTTRQTVDTIVTEMAYIRVTTAGLVLEEIAPALTAEDVQRATEPKLIVSPRLKTMPL